MTSPVADSDLPLPEIGVPDHTDHPVLAAILRELRERGAFDDGVPGAGAAGAGDAAEAVPASSGDRGGAAPSAGGAADAGRAGRIVVAQYEDAP